MALQGLFFQLVAGGMSKVALSIKSKKIRKKIDSGIVVKKDDLIWVAGYYVFMKKDAPIAKKYIMMAKAKYTENDDYVLRTLSAYYVLAKEFQLAIEILNKCIKKEPNDAKYNFDLGFCYFKLGCLEKAKKSQQKSIELDRSYRKKNI